MNNHVMRYGNRYRYKSLTHVIIPSESNPLRTNNYIRKEFSKQAKKNPLYLLLQKNLASLSHELSTGEKETSVQVEKNWRGGGGNR